MIRMGRSLGRKDPERSFAVSILEILERCPAERSEMDQLEIQASSERRDLSSDPRRVRYEYGLRRVLGIKETSYDLEE
jgi:hypothetical protein